jgi:hypothetical protein
VQSERLEILARVESIRLEELVKLDPSSAGAKSFGNPILNADVVLAAYQDAPGVYSLVYGESLLTETVQDQKPRDVIPLVVMLNSLHSDELHKLAAMVQVIRGGHDVPTTCIH